jgi:hypothetical protein
MKWRNIRYASPMPANFMHAGIQTPDGRFYVSARYSEFRTNTLNWAVLDWKTGTYMDGFAYRRDAKRFVEMGGLA